MKVKYQNIPTMGEPHLQAEGHVMEDVPGPWLSALILRKRHSHFNVTIQLGRNDLAALLKFVAKHDPDMYARMGEFADRERMRSE